MKIAVDLAWAAGFFDGEGNVGGFCEGRKLTAQIAQCDPEPLERFASIVECGHVNGPYTPKSPNAREHWKWSATRYEDIARMLDILQPYLTSIKRLQFEEALAKADEYRAGAHERMARNGRLSAHLRWHGDVEDACLV